MWNKPFGGGNLVGPLSEDAPAPDDTPAVEGGSIRHPQVRQTATSTGGAAPSVALQIS